MRILITNNHLAQMGGTETWVMTMVKELSKIHKVGVYTHTKGYISGLLNEYIDDNPKSYDLALVNHNTCKGIDAKIKIFTTHGTVPELEKPPKGMDYYVAVSENTSKYHNIPKIIKNPIDTDKFKPTSDINTEPRHILAITENKLPIESFRPSRLKDNMPELINRADVVVSMGRGALEAMSCARNVIVWDERPYWGARGNGYLLDLFTIRGNVVGHYEKREINWQEELSKYQQHHGARNREYILSNHDVKKIAQEYLDIWKKLDKIHTRNAT